jgi:hypothetical protein
MHNHFPTINQVEEGHPKLHKKEDSTLSLLSLLLLLLFLFLLRARIAGFQQVESHAARNNGKIGVKVVSKIQKMRMFLKIKREDWCQSGVEDPQDENIP